MKILLLSGLCLTIVGALTQGIADPPAISLEETASPPDTPEPRESQYRETQSGMKFFLSETRLDDSCTNRQLQNRSKELFADISVTFPDGYTDTIILGKHYFNEEQRMNSAIRGDDEDCNYSGYLHNEPEACVAMTGCLGEDDLVFTIMSSHTDGSPHFVWTKEGDVQTIENDPTVSFDSDQSMHQMETNSDQSMNQMRTIADEVCSYLTPPSSLLKLKIGYDELFFDDVGRVTTKAWSRIKDVFCHVQAAFCHASLGTKIQIDIGNSGHLVNNLRPDNIFAKDVKDGILQPLAESFYQKDSSINLVTYLTNNEGAGVARGSVCVHRAFSINQCGKINDNKKMLKCAKVLRHEIGHNLGMPHVYEDDLVTQKYPADWNCGPKEDIMGGNGREEWSPCSVISMRKLYTYASVKNIWCLKGQPNACTVNKCKENSFIRQNLKCSDPPSFQIPQGGKFSIYNKKNGLYLSVVNNKLKLTEQKMGANSQWKWKAKDDKYGYLISVGNSNKALDVSWSCPNGVCPVSLYGYHGGLNQQWTVFGDKLISKSRQPHWPNKSKNENIRSALKWRVLAQDSNQNVVTMVSNDDTLSIESGCVFSSDCPGGEQCINNVCEANCKDSNAWCAHYKAWGFCTGTSSTAQWVQNNCRKTCNKCVIRRSFRSDDNESNVDEAIRMN